MSAEVQPIPQAIISPFPIDRVRPTQLSPDAPPTIAPDNIRILPRVIPVNGEERESQRVEVPDTTKERPRKRLGTDAFNLEYEKTATRRDVRMDILTYLLEYRLRVQEFSYKYAFGKGEKGEGAVELRTDGEKKSVFDMTKKTIKDREKRGLPTHRENAEKRGAQVINEKLKEAEEGDVLLWASPPGPKSEGYGDYGFLFVGVVTNDEPDSTSLKSIHMKAIRLEKPTLEQYNQAWSKFTGEETKDQEADFFLASPTIRKLAPDVMRKTLQETFTFTVDPKKAKIAEQVLKDGNILIHALETAILEGTDAEKLEAFRAVENYTIERQKYYEENGLDERKTYRETRSTQELTASFGGYAAPAVEGSCGASNMIGGGGNMFSIGMESSGGGENSDSMIRVKSGKHNDVRIMSFGALKSSYPNKDRYDERYFKCPSCGIYNVRPEGELIANCYDCNKSVRCETSELAA